MKNRRVVSHQCVTFLSHFSASLQGSTHQREASNKEKKKVLPTFKDNDFVKDNVKIYLHAENRAEFLAKLKNDVDVSTYICYAFYLTKPP